MINFKKHIFVFVFVATLIPVLVITGWYTDTEILKSFNTEWASMKINTALGLVLFTCVLLSYTLSAGKLQTFGRILALCLLLFGLAELSQDVFQYNLGIDELLVKDNTMVDGNPPGRMAPITSICFILLGMAMVFFPVADKKYTVISESASTLTLILAFISFIGYLYNADKLYSIPSFTSISFPATISIGLFSVSLLLAKTEYGLIQVFSQNTASSKFGLRLIIWSFFLIITIGFIRLKAQDMGWFDTQFGLSLMIISFIIILAVSTWNIIKKLNISEGRKELLLQDLRKFSAHLQEVREEERTAISREVHDELGQQLTGLKMDILWIGKRISEKDLSVKARLEDIENLIDDTIVSVRRIAANLRPSVLDDLGLVTALQWHAAEVAKRSEITVHFESSVKELNITSEIAIGLFRIFQEALTNAVRHANAHHIMSSLETDKKNVYLKITDDGKGFDIENSKSSKTLGLMGIRERVFVMKGECILNSTPGRGTEIYIEIPIFGS